MLCTQLVVLVIVLIVMVTFLVMDEIVKYLHLDDFVIVRGDFCCFNLSFWVFPFFCDVERMEVLIRSFIDMGFRFLGMGCCIVYCVICKKVDAVHSVLKVGGFFVVFYHVGRTDSARAIVYKFYEFGCIPILVVINVFGMGIDNFDV